MMLAIALCLAAAADASHDGAFASIGHLYSGF